MKVIKLIEITNDSLLYFPNRFVIYSIGKGKHMVQSIPGELSLQETSVLTIASNQEQGFVTIDLLMNELKYV